MQVKLSILQTAILRLCFREITLQSSTDLFKRAVFQTKVTPSYYFCLCDSICFLSLCYPVTILYCFLFQLLKEINRTSVSRALRIRRQAGQSDPRAYVTAHFKTLPMEFTLGDGRNYGDFRNRPLVGGQEYVFFVLALLDLSENVSPAPNNEFMTYILTCLYKK